MKKHRFWAWAMLFCLAMVFTRVTSIDKKNRRIKKCWTASK